MTMKELAKLANVSVSTVSKAFCDADDVSAETKEHIFTIAKQYGCYGKFYKGKYHKKIIAIICPELVSSYYSAFAEKLQALIEASGGLCVISTDGFSETKQAELIEYYASYLKVDGLIVFDLRCRLKKGCRIPIVSLFSSGDSMVDSINIDIRSAIFDAVSTLTSLGHRNIAFLGERLTRKKELYFREAMEAAGIPLPQVVESSSRFEKAGVEGITQLHSSGALDSTTAIVCAYDNIAFGAVGKLKEFGKRVPEDISVIGIDNVPTGSYTQTTLTTIDTNPDEVCMIAWDLLQKKMENPYYISRQNIVIHARLIRRQSVAEVPGQVENRCP